MIFGIGIDIVEIDRIEKLIERHPSFVNKFFTNREIEYFKSKKNSYESIAGFFASKEAVSKALGTGFRNYGFKDIEVVKDELNKPSVRLHNKCKEYAKDNNIHCVHLSISHSKNYAVANAVAILSEE